MNRIIIDRYLSLDDSLKVNVKIKLILFLITFILVNINLRSQVNHNLLSYALETPKDIEENVISLTKYLIKETNSDKDKAEIIFYWISQNIEYDLEAYYENVYFDNYQETLERKRGICQNFSSLYSAMCRIAGLECYDISGYGKGYSFEKGTYFDGTNHSWNVVKVDSLYLLIDPTWGSGIYESKEYGFEYLKKINMKYVLQTPIKFLFDHLPSDPKWQLIDIPIKMEEFIWNKLTRRYDEFVEINYESNQVLLEYSKLEHTDQVINDLENALDYYYNDYISEILAIYCYDKAYKLSLEGKEKKDFVKSLNYYSKSKKAFENILISKPKFRKQLEDIKKGVTYTKYRLETL